MNKKCGFDLLKWIFSKNVIEEKRFRMSFYIEIVVEKFLFSKKKIAKNLCISEYKFDK